MGEGLACGVDGTLSHFLNVLQELGFGCPRVPQQQHVDVPTQAVRAGRVLLLTPEQGQRNSHLDVAVAVDAGGNALGNPLPCSAASVHVSE